jgi:uncharacterized protein
MIKRIIQNIIEKKLNDKKAIILLGPRQSGKTTLLHSIVENMNLQTLWLDGDEPDVRQTLPNLTSSALKSLIGNNKLLIIDEAQRIENIGLCLKLIVDNIKNVSVIASGSSSFELANKINESLTGRKWLFYLHPLSFLEMVQHTNILEERRQLENRLIYGSYPEIINNPGNQKQILLQLSDSYLYKDILTWERIQKPDKLERLLQAIAFQLGSEVSYRELSQITGLDNETVEKYINLLEKSYIIFRLGSLSRNLRNELKKSKKIYFYDNGIRNTLIKSFNPLLLRNDVGALWENYLISERIKHMNYSEIYANTFFWRTITQQEIDYIEERDGNFYGFEFKWNVKAKQKFPKTFTENYKNSNTELITPDNYFNFLGYSI